MIAVVAAREARALFRSPFAWWVLGAVQLLTAYQFLAQVDLFVQYLPRLRALDEPPGVTQFVVVPTFNLTSLLLLFLIPLLTMQAFAGERRSGVLPLWYSAPVRLATLVFGKFLGVMSLLAAVWALNALMPLTLLWGTTLDLGTYAAGLAGLALMMAAGSALGLWYSAMASQPPVAAVATFATLLGLWLLDWASHTAEAPGVLAELSMLAHFQRLSRGLVDTFDIAYFVLMTVGALALAVCALAGERDGR